MAQPDSDRELFEQSMKPEAAPPLPKDEDEGPEGDDAPEPQADQPSGEEQPRKARAERIPLKDHLEEREKRQAAERERDTIKADRERDARERDELRRELAQLRQPKAEQAPPPDVLVDPAGYAASIREQIQREMTASRINQTFEDIRDQNPAEFDKAYGEFERLVQSGDYRLRDSVTQATNPGRALMRWHKERTTVQEIGGDLNAYKEKLRQEALNDPEFRKKAMEAWRTQAGATDSPQRQNAPDLPSLNRATGAGSAAADDNRWESDRELASNVFRRPKRA